MSFRTQWKFDDEVDIYLGRAFRRMILTDMAPAIEVRATLYEAVVLVERSAPPNQVRAIFAKLHDLETVRPRRMRR